MAIYLCLEVTADLLSESHRPSLKTPHPVPERPPPAQHSAMGSRAKTMGLACW